MKKYYIIPLLLCFLGCSTFKPIEGDVSYSSIVSQLSPVDEIEVFTQGGEKIEMEVEAITQSEIIGGNVAVQIENIKSIKLKKISKKNTAAAYTGSLLTGTVVS